MIRDTLFINYNQIREMYTNYIRFFMISLGKIVEDGCTADLKGIASTYLTELVDLELKESRSIKLKECIISIRQSKRFDLSNMLLFIYLTYPYELHEENSFTKLYLKNSIKENRLINNLLVLNEGDFTNEIVYRFFENVDIFFKDCALASLQHNSYFRKVIDEYYKNQFELAFGFIKEELRVKLHFTFSKYPSIEIMKPKKEVVHYDFLKLTTSNVNQEKSKAVAFEAKEVSLEENEPIDISNEVLMNTNLYDNETLLNTEIPEITENFDLDHIPLLIDD